MIHAKRIGVVDPFICESEKEKEGTTTHVSEELWKCSLFVDCAP